MSQYSSLPLDGFSSVSLKDTVDIFSKESNNLCCHWSFYCKGVAKGPHGDYTAKIHIGKPYDEEGSVGMISLKMVDGRVHER